jgi:hypothetical protein
VVSAFHQRLTSGGQGILTAKTSEDDAPRLVAGAEEKVGPAIGAEPGTTNAQISPKAGVGGVGDPHMSNVAGVGFEIFPSGTFGFLSLKDKADGSSKLLTIDGTIGKANEACHAWTWIQELALKGDWINAYFETESISARAATGKPVDQSLEVNLGHGWKTATSKVLARPKNEEKSWMSQKRVVLNLHGIKIKIVIKQHNVDKERRFLNIQIDGLKEHAAQFQIGGLLGYGDHEYVSKPPEHCKPDDQEKAALLNKHHIKDDGRVFQSFVRAN